MANEPVRAASVGLGRWSKVIAAAVGRTDKIEIVNCFDVIQENVDSFAAEFGCSKAASYEELLADDQFRSAVQAMPGYHIDRMGQISAIG